MASLEELENENRRLRRSVAELSVLAEIASAVGLEPSLQAVIELIVQKSVRALGVEQGAVYLLSDDEDEQTFETVWREARSSGIQLPYKLGDQVIGWMLQHQRPLEVNDLETDTRFHGIDRGDPPIRSLLAVPLRFKARLMGLLVVYNKKGPEGFSEDDRRLLGIIAGHAAPVLQSAKVIGDLRRDRERLEGEVNQLWREVASRFSERGFLGSSRPVRELLRLIERIRDTDVDVLITGESGTGKDLYAKTIHYSSRRARRPFVTVSPSALSPETVEAELFGVEAELGDPDRKTGQIESADKGTLFIDEIELLPRVVQAKLAKVLQERAVRRVGGREPLAVDLRVVASASEDLAAQVADKTFDAALYRQLSAVQMRTPPLRTVREDIVPLANHFLAEGAKQLGRAGLRFSEAALDCLLNADWPGNVRQLENEVKRAAVCAPGELIQPSDLSEDVAAAGKPAADPSKPPTRDIGGPLGQAVADYEKRLLEKALEKAGNDIEKAAAILGISESELATKMVNMRIAAP